MESRSLRGNGTNGCRGDWCKRIRDQLAAEGVILEDQPGRTRWRLGGSCDATI